MNGATPQAYWVGLDVSARKFDAAICYCGSNHERWMKQRTREFSSTPAGIRQFSAWLAREEGTCEGLCAEATGVYSQDLAQLLEEHGKLPGAAGPMPLPRLSIENPSRIKGAAAMLGANGKSDPIDARVIATFGAIKKPAPKAPLAPPYQRLRDAMKLRETLVRHQLSLENSLRNGRDKECCRVLRRAAASIRRQSENAEARITELIQSEEQLARDFALLQTIPTVGPIVAAALLATFGDLATWDRRSLIAYSGLAPLPRESGTSLRSHRRISKRGGKLLRAKHYLSATRLLTKDYGFNRKIIERYKAGQPAKVLIISAIAKVLLIARAIVRSGQPFDRARFGGAPA